MLVKRFGRFPKRILTMLLVVALAIAFLGPFASAMADPRNAPSASPNSTGMIVPLYTSPTDGSWAALKLAKASFPNVPVVAIVNPASGPGRNVSSEYATGIRDLQAAGITVLGYVATNYGSRPIAPVEQEVQDYASWYHVNGTMFDEMASATGHEGYYQALNAYAKSLGMTYTVGNPGQTVATGYVGLFDTLIIFEDSGLPSASSIFSFPHGYARSNFAVVSYGVDSLRQSSVVAQVSSSAGYVYFTNGTLPNPYQSLPLYLVDEAWFLSLSNQGLHHLSP